MDMIQTLFNADFKYNIPVLSIIACSVAAIILVLILIKTLKKAKVDNIAPPFFGERDFDVSEDIGGPRIIPDLTIQQLEVKDDAVTGIIHEIRIMRKYVPKSGKTIGRNDFVKTKASSTVSKTHLYIGVDEYGFFARDKGSLNHTYLFDRKNDTVIEVDKFAIEHGTLACLGEQWVRFMLKKHIGVKVGIDIPSAIDTSELIADTIVVPRDDVLTRD